jgi:hypothetical protein
VQVKATGVALVVKRVLKCFFHFLTAVQKAVLKNVCFSFCFFLPKLLSYNRENLFSVFTHLFSIESYSIPFFQHLSFGKGGEF